MWAEGGGPSLKMHDARLGCMRPCNAKLAELTYNADGTIQMTDPFVR